MSVTKPVQPATNTFSLRRVFLWMVVVGLFLAGFAKLADLVRLAQYDTEVTRYGGRRFTRAQAESMAGHGLGHIPDKEFLRPAGVQSP